NILEFLFRVKRIILPIPLKKLPIIFVLLPRIPWVTDLTPLSHNHLQSILLLFLDLFLVGLSKRPDLHRSSMWWLRAPTSLYGFCFLYKGKCVLRNGRQSVRSHIG